MSYQQIQPPHSVTGYTPEEREKAREFCQTLVRARTDRRVFAQLLTDAFIRGMEAQEQMFSGERPRRAAKG